MNVMTTMRQRFGIFLTAMLLAVGSWLGFVSPAAAETHTVKMGSDSFSLVYVPSEIDIQPGDTIKFINNKIPPHNVIFDPADMPAPELADQLSHKGLMYAAGDSFEVTFPEDAPAGKYGFYCQPHRGAGMVGQVIVSES
ncbi:plastocyanin [Geitlerinema sp. PCC 9228]|jgi:plastocyanin|uniref:plastocyanin n=1 Tax=Geitlerinema sp. PCC 9228 TaxID=111611 RepID=UPI0008F9CAC5|nr:plastocyanin [Geitlerinema sp. PCC 9228]